MRGIVAAVVVGLGVDIVEIDRCRAALERWGERVVGRLMSPDEAARLPSAREARARALAHAVAAKEAASKSIGTGWSRGVRWRDVVVTLSPAHLELHAEAMAWARRLGSDGAGSLRFSVKDNLVVAEFRLLSR